MNRDNIDRYLAGEGTYTPDLSLPGMRHVAFVRSPHPHARIEGIDASSALALAGVRGLVTGADLPWVVRPGLPTPPFQPLTWPLLCVDKARYVGDPVAAVIADSPYLAADAAELVEVQYSELPYVDNVSAATATGAPLLYEHWDSNIFATETFSRGDVTARLAGAAGVITETFLHHRICGFPLEGQGVCAHRDVAGRLVVYASTQYPHQLQAMLADLTGVSPTDVRVIAPDVGGGFGIKQHVTREELVVGILAGRLPWPVRWTENIPGMLTHGIHARAQRHEVTAGYLKDGRISALHLRVTADVGNPLLCFTGAGPALVAAASLPGAYSVPAYSYEVSAVATNTSPVGGLRGFGQPEALLSMERTLDLIAARLDMSRADIRRLNLIPDDPRPYVSPTGFVVDVGSIRSQFERLLETVQSGSGSHADAHTGLGFACYVEPTATSVPYAGNYVAYETATLTVHPDGHIVAGVGTKDVGQGNRATFAKIVADEIGLHPADVTVRDGDTDLVPIGLGTMGSRTLVMTGAALRNAAALLRQRLATMAAHVLEVPPEAVTFQKGTCEAAGRAITLPQLAALAYLTPTQLPPSIELGMSVTGSFHARHVDSEPDSDGRINPAATYSSQVAAATVRVDPATGEVTATDFTIVYDCGTVANERAVAGQLQGSFALGLSAVLSESLEYVDGHPITDTYVIARCPDVPPVRAIAMPTPSALPGGGRGVGQMATILAPAAIANAIEDALKPLGIRIRGSQLTPAELRRLLHQTGD